MRLQQVYLSLLILFTTSIVQALEHTMYFEYDHGSPTVTQTDNIVTMQGKGFNSIISKDINFTSKKQYSLSFDIVDYNTTHKNLAITLRNGIAGAGTSSIVYQDKNISTGDKVDITFTPDNNYSNLQIWHDIGVPVILSIKNIQLKSTLRNTKL